jgi:hypothetical protein
VRLRAGSRKRKIITSMLVWHFFIRWASEKLADSTGAGGAKPVVVFRGVLGPNQPLFWDLHHLRR